MDKIIEKAIQKYGTIAENLATSCKLLDPFLIGSNFEFKGLEIVFYTVAVVFGILAAARIIGTGWKGERRGERILWRLAAVLGFIAGAALALWYWHFVISSVEWALENRKVMSVLVASTDAFKCYEPMLKAPLEGSSMHAREALGILAAVIGVIAWFFASTAVLVLGYLWNWVFVEKREQA